MECTITFQIAKTEYNNYYGICKNFRCQVSVYGDSKQSLKIVFIIQHHPNGSHGNHNFWSPHLQSTLSTQWQPGFLLWVDHFGSLLWAHWCWLPVPLSCRKEIIFIYTKQTETELTYFILIFKSLIFKYHCTLKKNRL